MWRLPYIICLCCSVVFATYVTHVRGMLFFFVSYVMLMFVLCVVVPSCGVRDVCFGLLCFGLDCIRFDSV